MVFRTYQNMKKYLYAAYFRFPVQQITVYDKTCTIQLMTVDELFCQHVECMIIYSNDIDGLYPTNNSAYICINPFREDCLQQWYRITQQTAVV